MCRARRARLDKGGGKIHFPCCIVHFLSHGKGRNIRLVTFDEDPIVSCISVVVTHKKSLLVLLYCIFLWIIMVL